MNLGSLNYALVAQMLAVFGEDTVRRMLTIPGAVCTRQALKNHDNPEQMIAKRDAFIDALLDFSKEWANLDND